MRRFFLLFTLGVCALAALYLVVVFQWSYSSGERVGWVQKFSRKGWVCKTWEGELAMATVPGSVSEKFYFTVRDDALAEKVNASVGPRVRLHYEQHRGIPGSCFGETEYWVDGIVPTGDPAPSIPSDPAATPRS